MSLKISKGKPQVVVFVQALCSGCDEIKALIKKEGVPENVVQVKSVDTTNNDKYVENIEELLQIKEARGVVPTAIDNKGGVYVGRQAVKFIQELVLLNSIFGRNNGEKRKNEKP